MKDRTKQKMPFCVYLVTLICQIFIADRISIFQAASGESQNILTMDRIAILFPCFGVCCQINQNVSLRFFFHFVYKTFIMETTAKCP